MDAVSEVKARISIEDVIGEYVRLKRTGRNYKGLSPFTNEKTPSFVVSPDKNIWHDFSSGKGGDVFTFIMQAENIEFKDALELLARKAGVDLDQFNDKTKTTVKKEPLYEVLKDAAHFYQKSLLKNKKAMDYLSKKRKFNKQTVLDFQIGYSPDSGNALFEYLKKKGHKTDLMKKTGLLSEYRGKDQDMFRGRIMLPLADSFGRVVGFTARILEDNPKAPKYINTPSTILYDKSRHVYGLHLAKNAIKEQKFSVVVEGNLDVVSSHQVGVKNVVAIAGTALTKFQTKSLAGLSENIRLSFDQDRAGLAATERSLEVVADQSVNLSVITVPEGKDPDELIQKNPAAWQEAINNYEYATDWVIKKYAQEFDLSKPNGKRDFGDKVTEILRKIKDPIEREHYIDLTANMAGISAQALKERIYQKSQTTETKIKKPVKQIAKDDQKLVELKKSVDQLLSITLFMIGTRRFLKDLSGEIFPTLEQKAVFEFLIKNETAEPNITKYPQLREQEDYVKILAVNFEELFQDIETLELQYEAERLKNKIIEQYVRVKKLEISEQLATADKNQERVLLKESGKLVKMLSEKKVQNG